MAFDPGKQFLLCITYIRISEFGVRLDYPIKLSTSAYYGKNCRMTWSMDGDLTLLSKNVLRLDSSIPSLKESQFLIFFFFF